MSKLSILKRPYQRGMNKVREFCLCVYCGKKLSKEEVYVDHFLPASYSFEAYREDNLLPSCQECNSIKSDTMFETVEDARLYINYAKLGKINEYWKFKDAVRDKRMTSSSAQKFKRL